MEQHTDFDTQDRKNIVFWGVSVPGGIGTVLVTGILALTQLWFWAVGALLVGVIGTAVVARQRDALMAEAQAKKAFGRKL